MYTYSAFQVGCLIIVASVCVGYVIDRICKCIEHRQQTKAFMEFMKNPSAAMTYVEAQKAADKAKDK